MKLNVKRSLVLIFAVLLTSSLYAQGKWEFGVHYSRWGLNLIRSMIEDKLNDTLESDLKDKFLEEIQNDHPGLRETNYSQNIRFDSGGHNYGIEVRFYPSGREGSFSLGFSLEKTTMRVSFPEVSGVLDMDDQITHQTARFDGNASGEFLLKPFSFHLSFRWDILPSARIHPYLTLGFGASTASAINKATYSYQYSGTLDIPGEPSKTYSDAETKSLKQLKEEQEAKGEDFPIPVNFLPFLQLNLGLKGRLTENLYLLVDAGIWDGFLLRGGLAYRF